MDKSNKIPEMGKNKYSKDFKVPDGFDEILRGLTREILREQPQDINKFGKCHLYYHSYQIPRLSCISMFFPAFEYFSTELQNRALASDM